MSAGVVLLSVGVLVAAWTLLQPGDSARERQRGPAALTLDGTLLQEGDDRFVIAGTSAYVLPFYEASGGGRDEALAETTERSYQQREQLVAEMREAGVNTLRIPVALSAYEEDVYGLGGQEAYLDRLRDVVSAAAAEDIRVIVGWWDSHGAGDRWLEDYEDVYPMMRDVREALQAYPSVMYEPFNEPHDVTWDEWEPVMADVLRFWREDLEYDGVLFVDTIDYSWSFDPEPARRLLELDGELRASTPAIVFANHRYANDETCFCGDTKQAWEQEVGQHLDEFPIAGTEYGRWTGPDFEPQEQWNADFAEHITEVAVPAGLNGYIAFVWDWVDENSMTRADGLELNSYGRLVVDEVLRPLSSM